MVHIPGLCIPCNTTYVKRVLQNLLVSLFLLCARPVAVSNRCRRTFPVSTMRDYNYSNHKKARSIIYISITFWRRVCTFPEDTCILNNTKHNVITAILFVFYFTHTYVSYYVVFVVVNNIVIVM